MRIPRSVRAALTLLCLVYGVIMTVWAYGMADHAYRNTPNVPDFGTFADPNHASGRWTKETYLLTPVGLGFFAVFILLCRAFQEITGRLDWEAKVDPKQTLIMVPFFGVFFLFALIASWSHSEKALAAAQRIGWSQNPAGGENPGQR